MRIERRERRCWVLLAEDGFVAARDVAAVLDGEVGIGAVRYTLDALAQEGLLEQRNTGPRKPPLFRVLDPLRARAVASEAAAVKPKARSRETLSARVLEREGYPPPRRWRSGR